MSDAHTIRATATTTVKSFESRPFDEMPGAPTLSDNHLTETFSGDIIGDGVVHTVQAARAGDTASFVGIERVRGSIGGKSGSFLLQVRGTVAGKAMTAEWFVVPGSATDELEGLRGEGGFTAQLGEHGEVWLDYHFEGDTRR